MGSTDFIRAFATAGAMMWTTGQGLAENIVTASVDPEIRATLPFEEGRILDDSKFIRFGSVSKRVAGHVEFCKRFANMKKPPQRAALKNLGNHN